MTLVDLEHCFFNLAIDTEGLAAPHRPETFDRMAPDELAAQGPKRGCSRRGRRVEPVESFFTDTPKGSAIDEAFHAGFLDFYRRQQARTDELSAVFYERVHAEPPVVIGTHGYRRALADVDIADIRSRLAIDAQAAYEGAW